MKIFIDANIYLGFIRLSQEKTDYLLNFKKLVSDKKLSLVFPKITQDEVFRQIPNVSNTYLAELKTWLPPEPKFAVSVEGKRKAKTIYKLYLDYKKKFKGLRSEYLKSVGEFQKEILNPLTKNAINCYEKGSHIKLAELRKKKGNPPGKGNHIGDEIVWELILSECIDDDVAIVSNDADWKSPLQSNKPTLHPFLVKEWNEHSSKSIDYFDSLGGFMKTQYKEEVKESDIKKEKQATLSVNNLSAYFSASPSLSNVSTSAVSSASMNYISPPVPSSGSANFYSSLSPSASIRSSSVIVCPNCGQPVNRDMFPYTIAILCPYCNFAIPVNM